MITAAAIEASVSDALLAESSSYAALLESPANSRSYTCCAPGCVRKAYANGVCNVHHMRQRNGQAASAPIRNRKNGTACLDCGKVPDAKGGWFRCMKHYRLRRRRLIKQVLIEIFGGQCAKCSGKFPQEAFDFHHLGSKTDSPSYLIVNGGIGAMAAELSGCLLLCANCHRTEHAHE